MGYDPRAVANALLDIAHDQGVEFSNLSLNKVEFFAHSDFLWQIAEGMRAV